MSFSNNQMASDGFPTLNTQTKKGLQKKQTNQPSLQYHHSFIFNCHQSRCLFLFFILLFYFFFLYFFFFHRAIFSFFQYFNQNNRNKTNIDIFVCAQNGDLNTLKVYVEQQGVNINSKEPDGSTALHWAAFHDRLPIVQYLVERGYVYYPLNLNLKMKRN